MKTRLSQIHTVLNDFFLFYYKTQPCMIFHASQYVSVSKYVQHKTICTPYASNNKYTEAGHYNNDMSKQFKFIHASNYLINRDEQI